MRGGEQGCPPPRVEAGLVCVKWGGQLSSLRLAPRPSLSWTERVPPAWSGRELCAPARALRSWEGDVMPSLQGSGCTPPSARVASRSVAIRGRLDARQASGGSPARAPAAESVGARSGVNRKRIRARTAASESASSSRQGVQAGRDLRCGGERSIGTLANQKVNRDGRRGRSPRGERWRRGCPNHRAGR